MVNCGGYDILLTYYVYDFGIPFKDWLLLLCTLCMLNMTLICCCCSWICHINVLGLTSYNWILRVSSSSSSSLLYNCFKMYQLFLPSSKLKTQYKNVAMIKHYFFVCLKDERKSPTIIKMPIFDFNLLRLYHAIWQMIVSTNKKYNPIFSWYVKYMIQLFILFGVTIAIF